MTDDPIRYPVLKGISAVIAAIGGLTWSQTASMVATIYTTCLLIEWVWKRLLKPYAQRRGWVGGHRKAFLDSTDRVDLDVH